MIQTLPLSLLCGLLLAYTSIFANKPNILWIITDDHRADAIAAYNQAVNGNKESPLGYVESPNIDAIAKEGVLFTKAYCQSPGCAPSRASMHTGMYPWHSGVYGFEKTHIAASHYKGDVPTVMKSQGYHTSYFGKGHIHLFQWENGAINSDDLSHLYDQYADHQDMRNHNYTDWKKRSGTFDGIKGTKEYWINREGETVSFFVDVATGHSIPVEDAAVRQQYEKEKGIIRKYTTNSDAVISGESPAPSGMTNDGLIVAEFQKYLDNANGTYQAYDGSTSRGANTNEPQFINLGFHFPHTPVTPPKSFRDKFRNKEYKIPNFSAEEKNDLTAMTQLNSWFGESRIDEMTYEEKQDVIRDYYAFCAFGDSLVGETIKTFKKYCSDNGQEYLIVLALGDHGWHLGEQGGENKFGPFDTSNHTTLIVESSDKSRFPANRIVNDFAEYVDFAPTFYRTAGVDLSKNAYSHLDGYDLGEVVNGNKPPRKYTLGGMNQIFGERSYIRTEDFSFSMRTRSGWNKPTATDILKNVTWPLTTGRDNVEMALYDLRVDPEEHNNLANDVQYKALADWFRTKLGNIVLGDDRIECDWTKENVWDISSFAKGSDDKQLSIPNHLIPSLAEAKIPLTSLQLTPSVVTLDPGEELYLIPSFFPYNTTQRTLSWSSTNGSVVRVEDGIITAVSSGVATVIVKSTQSNSISASTEVTVTGTTVEGEQFYILNKKTGMKIRQKVGSASGDQLEQVPASWSGDPTIWVLVPTSNDYFYLQNVETGMYFRPSDDTDGSVLVQRPTNYSGGYTQWKKVPASNEFFYLENRSTRMYFRPETDQNYSTMIQCPTSYGGDWTQWSFVSVTSGNNLRSTDTQGVQEGNVVIHPVPAQNQLTLTGLEKGIHHISIHAMDGNIVIEKQIDASGKTERIDVSSIPSGIYFLIISNEQTRRSFKIVKE